MSNKVFVIFSHLAFRGGVNDLFNLLQLIKINNIQYFSFNLNI
jgi:hypothetical protein